MMVVTSTVNGAERKEKSMLSSDHNKGLLRRQPRAMTIGQALFRLVLPIFSLCSTPLDVEIL